MEVTTYLFWDQSQPMLVKRTHFFNINWYQNQVTGQLHFHDPKVKASLLLDHNELKYEISNFKRFTMVSAEKIAAILQKTFSNVFYSIMKIIKFGIEFNQNMFLGIWCCQGPLLLTWFNINPNMDK